jgi:hypothetical protein
MAWCGYTSHGKTSLAKVAVTMRALAFLLLVTLAVTGIQAAACTPFF